MSPKIKYFIFIVTFFLLAIYSAYEVAILEIYAEKVELQVISVETVEVEKCKRKRLLCQLGLTEKNTDKEYVHEFIEGENKFYLTKPYPLDIGRKTSILYMVDEPENSDFNTDIFLLKWFVLLVMLFLSVICAAIYLIRHR